MKKKKINIIIIIITLILCCQNYENPFENSNNSDVHVLGQGTTFSINEIDTINIFTSETLLVTTTVPELIDSFTISVSKNRHFSSRTIINPTAQKYSFLISTYDTGNQCISIRTYKKNGSLTNRIIPLYSSNPLCQADLLLQNLNDSITLKTTPVGDNVIYTWIIGNHSERSPFPFSHTKLFQMHNDVKTGYLYVSDSCYNSPKTVFKYSFFDAEPPSIICVNNNYDPSTKTIKTADSTLLFRVHIYDGDYLPVTHAFFNGQSADYIYKNAYSKVINNLKNHTSVNPYKIIAFAIDNNYFYNTATDTFYIVFDPHADVKDSTCLHVNILNDTLLTSTYDLTINGTISNLSAKPVSLRTLLDGKELFSQYYPQGDGLWGCSFAISSDTCKFTIQARNTTDSILTKKDILIIYSYQLVDTTNPSILSIQVNGIEGKTQYVCFDSITFSIDAYDYGSGINQILIDGKKQSIIPGQTNWKSVIKAIHHEWKKIQVSVVDLKGNKTDDAINVFQNNLPSAILPELPFAICKDSLYTSEIITSDKDGDIITIIIKHKPIGMSFFNDYKEISWNTTTQDTGKDSLIFQLYDQNQNTELYRQYYYVYNKALANKSIKLSSQQNIPPFLQAAKDTLKFIIKLKDLTGTVPYSYLTRISTKSQVYSYKSTDSILEWVPGIHDTGKGQLSIYVTDGLQESDTFITSINILPPNNDSVSLGIKSITNATKLDDGTIFINPPSIAIVNIVIIDKDHPLTEDHIVTITMNGSTSLFHADSSVVQISIDPSHIKSRDTIIITVSDKTSPLIDTLLLPVLLQLNNPKSLPNLVKWYSPGNCYIKGDEDDDDDAIWYNHDSLEYNLSIPTAKILSSALNSYSTVKINSSYLYDLKEGKWIADSFSIFIVAKYDLQPSEHLSILSSTTDKCFTTIGIFSDGKIELFKESDGDESKLTISKSSLTTVNKNWHIYSFQSRGVISNKISIHAGVNFQFDSLSLNGTSAKNDLMIGTSTKTFPKSSWNGEFAEIIFYNRLLSETENISVIRYLASKYNIK